MQIHMYHPGSFVIFARKQAVFSANYPIICIVLHGEELEPWKIESSNYSRGDKMTLGLSYKNALMYLEMFGMMVIYFSACAPDSRGCGQDA